MTQAVSIRFGKTILLLGDGATPENFVAPCGLEDLALQVQIATNDTAVPDCDDPDLAAWMETDVVSQQMRITGQGILDETAMQTWQAWWLTNAGLEKNVRWFRNLTGAQGGGYFQAPGILTAYSETGKRGSRWTLSIAIALNGKPVFTAAA